MKKATTVLVVGVLAAALTGASILPGCESKTDKGVFRSDDGGNFFEHTVVVDEKNSINSLNVTDLAFDPVNKGVAYVSGLASGVYKTSNSGDTWKPLFSDQLDVYALAVDPSNPDIVYASSVVDGKGRIFKSITGGEEQFQSILINTKDESPVIGVLVDFYDPQKVYAISPSGELFRSLDKGETWSLYYLFSEQHKNVKDITTVTMSPADSRILFVGTNDGMYRSGDGGESFDRVFGGRGADDETQAKVRTINDLAFDVGNPNRVYLATDYSLFYSSDAGSSWQLMNKLPLTPGSVSILQVAVGTTDTIYAAAGATLYKSTDNGQSWLTSGVDTAKQISDIGINPFASEQVFVGVAAPEK